MIGRVYRGGHVGGLLRYLYGPGRANEHENPHLVAAWDLETAAELATLEPEVLAGEGARAVRDFGPMTASMELATALRRIPESVAARQVWHCPLRVAPGDRTLTDAEWAQVAREVVHRTGIAERGDDGGCRWIAVRHDAHSVHLVAVLARQDGRPVRLSHDHLKVRQACRDAEARLGLVRTAPADRTAATHSTRAEVEKAFRVNGQPSMTDREVLREQVQRSALQTSNTPEFLAHLGRAGVMVRERRDQDGRLTGYAVARNRPQGRVGQAPVFFGGGKLAPDLSLPKLQSRWQEQAAVEPLQIPTRSASGFVPGDARRAAVVDLAAQRVREAVASRDPAAVRDAGALAQATGELLAAVGRAVDGPPGKVLRVVARQYDRASREPEQRRPAPTPHSRALQDLGRALFNGGRGGSDALALIGQTLLLVDAVRQLREAQGRVAQAQAAQRAARGLRLVVQHEQEQAAARVAAVRQGLSSSARPGARPPARTQAPSARRSR